MDAYQWAKYATHPFLKTHFSTNLHHTPLVCIVHSCECQFTAGLVTMWNEYVSLETSSSPLFCLSFIKLLPQVKFMDLGQVINIQFYEAESSSLPPFTSSLYSFKCRDTNCHHANVSRCICLFHVFCLCVTFWMY